MIEHFFLRYPFLFAGPVFARELVTAPRRPRLYIYRSVYAASLVLLMCTAWLIQAGAQVIRNVGDMAQFGSILFQLLVPLQLSLVGFFAALSTASSVAQEKDRGTLILLLMTRMSNSELVLGKLMASLLNVFVMLAAGLPVFMLTLLFGGISFLQVSRVFLVTLAAIVAAGTLGSTIAFWRDKTFQTLSMTALIIVLWLGFWEAVAGGLLATSFGGISGETWASAFSPVRAVLVAALSDDAVAGSSIGLVGGPVTVFLCVSVLQTVSLAGIAIWHVRVWNPSQEVRPQVAHDTSESGSIWGLAACVDDPMNSKQAIAEEARSGHVDQQLRQRKSQPHRSVWQNPILWREVCTWAYGRKVIIIKVIYLVVFVMAAVGLHVSSESVATLASRAVVEPSAKPLIPLYLVSLVIVNALAVTTVTNERDGKSLDLLLVTDLSPREFLFGKLVGALWVTKEMVVAPMLLTVYLWWSGGISGENLTYVLHGLFVMYLFVTMLGIHCGMIYSNSKVAVGISIGTVFFLFLGVITCILMMISFSGSFQVQLAPFLAFILGGGVGLYVSLGIRNPSGAIAAASLLLPFATFYAITSFLLDYSLAVFVVTVFTYGFTTAAMMIPALHEFNFAMGRTATSED